MVRPWAEAGYRCICVDMQAHDDEPNIEHVVADVRDYLPPLADYAIVFAFPPCTHTSVSGAAWFKQKGPTAAAEAFGILNACIRICEWSGAAWMIENPVSTFSTYWREPDYIFQPWEYSHYLEESDATPLADNDAYSKKTCLWTGGGFEMPKPKPWQGLVYDAPHRLPPSDDRANLRSITPMGFARAVFQANHKLESTHVA